MSGQALAPGLGSGGWFQAVTEDAVVRQQRAFLWKEEGKRKEIACGEGQTLSLCSQAVESSVPVATAALEGSQKTCERISFLEGLTVSFDVLFLKHVLET